VSLAQAQSLESALEPVSSATEGIVRWTPATADSIAFGTLRVCLVNK
jgi:hypothetical protein